MRVKRKLARRIYYRKLRERMSALQVTGADLARQLRVQTATISRKLGGKSPWFLDEIYEILEYLKIPFDEMYLFFPKDGEDAESIPHHYVQAYLEETNQALVPRTCLEALNSLVGTMCANN